MAYNFNINQTGAKKSAKNTITLQADMGLRTDFPVEYDDNVKIAQRISAFVGGWQLYNFTSSFMDFLIRVKFYPLWADGIFNQITFRKEDLTLCDEAFYGWQVGKVVVDFEIGIDVCEVTVYDNLLG